MMFSFRYFLASGLLLSFLLGCNRPEDKPQGDSFDRGALLSHLAETQIVPGYAAYAATTQALLNDAMALADDVTYSPEEATEELFDGLSSSFEAVYLAWQDVALFDFGPAMTFGLLATTNTYPTDVSGIEEAIAGADFQPGTAASLAHIGLPALDYLLHMEGGWTRFSTEAGYAAHVVALCAFANDQSQAVSAAWVDYTSIFSQLTGTEMGSSMGELLNAFCRTYESNTRRQKLGLPCGAATFSGTPLPDHVEAFYADEWSVALLKRAVEAFDRLYTGGTGLGLDDYLRSLGAEHHGSDLDAETRMQTIEVFAALDDLASPLSEFVVTNQEVSLAVYAELQALVVLWKVDMMSALGILVTYQDNDGD